MTDRQIIFSVVALSIGLIAVSIGGVIRNYCIDTLTNRINAIELKLGK